MTVQFRWRGEEAKRIAHQAGMKALTQAAEDILGEAVDEAPVDEGTLRRSGTATPAPSESAVYISFNTPYALRQHEVRTYRHPRGGKAKYLEDPFKRIAPKAPRLVQLRVREALRRTP